MDDPDLDRLTDAFAALVRSRKRVDAIIEHDVSKDLGVEPPTISELIASLRSGEPITDLERRILIDYLNIMAVGAQDSGQHGLQADQSNE